MKSVKVARLLGALFLLYDKKEAREDKVWSVPQGDLPAVIKQLDKSKKKYKLIDKRISHKLRHKKVKFTGKLRAGEKIEGIATADQVSAVKQWLKHKSGVLAAPARSGKTVLATYLYCQLGLKDCYSNASKRVG